MAWAIQENRQLGFVEINYSGTVTNQDTREAATELLSCAHRQGPLIILANASGAESTLSISQSYEDPALWTRLGADRRNKMAILASRGSKLWEDAQFYENISVNRGWTVRLFAERQPAIDWLTDVQGNNE